MNNMASKKKSPPTETVVRQLRTLTLKNTLTVNVSEDVLKQIQYLCQSIATVEWSGILFYSIKGDVSKIADAEITLEYVLPMHKGTGGSTEYDFDEEYVKFRMEHPEGLNWLAGHIHSHHGMSAYFSGTDNSEIHDNSEFHNYYLSVVVNNAGDMVGKLGFRGKSESKLKYICKDSVGSAYEIPVNMDEQVLFVRNCNMVIPTIEDDMDKDFTDRVAEIIKKSVKSARFMPAHNSVIGYNYNQSGGKNNKTYKTDKPKKFPGGWEDTSGLNEGMQHVLDLEDLPDAGIENGEVDIIDWVDEFMTEWITLGRPEEVNYDVDTAIRELGKRIRDDKKVFVMTILLSNFRASVHRYFESIDSDDMLRIAIAVTDLFEEYQDSYYKEIETVVLPSMLDFIKTLESSDVKPVMGGGKGAEA